MCSQYVGPGATVLGTMIANHHVGAGLTDENFVFVDCYLA